MPVSFADVTDINTSSGDVTKITRQSDGVVLWEKNLNKYRFSALWNRTKPIFKTTLSGTESPGDDYNQLVFKNVKRGDTYQLYPYLILDTLDNKHFIELPITSFAKSNIVLVSGNRYLGLFDVGGKPGVFQIFMNEPDKYYIDKNLVLHVDDYPAPKLNDGGFGIIGFYLFDNYESEITDWGFTYPEVEGKCTYLGMHIEITQYDF